MEFKLWRVSMVFGLSLWAVLPLLAWAVPINNCDKLMWDPNTEPDLAGYNVYVAKDNVPFPVVPVPAPTAEVDCPTARVVEGANYAIEFTAFDMSGNESAKSVPILAEWPDVTPPDPPTGTCLMTLDAVTGLQCVAAP